MGKPKDLIGAKFGNLVVIKKAAPHITPSGRKHAMWECKCKCGTVCNCYQDHLLRGHTKSCGCGQGTPTGEKHPNFTHGQYKSRLYRIWQGMKRRCYCETSMDWQYYGGRGIRICDEWKKDFSAFHDWAMANGYDEKAPIMQCTIDRINVDGDYCPENCRWADARTQRVNQRRGSAKNER